jgi:hypothetical protein
VHQRHQGPQEIRGSVVEGPAFSSNVNTAIEGSTRERAQEMH